MGALNKALGDAVTRAEEAEEDAAVRAGEFQQLLSEKVAYMRRGAAAEVRCFDGCGKTVCSCSAVCNVTVGMMFAMQRPWCFSCPPRFLLRPVPHCRGHSLNTRRKWRSCRQSWWPRRR